MGRKKIYKNVVVELPYAVSIFIEGKRVYNCSYATQERLEDNYKYIQTYLKPDWKLHEEKPDLPCYGVIKMENEQYYAY